MNRSFRIASIDFKIPVEADYGRSLAGQNEWLHVPGKKIQFNANICQICKCWNHRSTHPQVIQFTLIYWKMIANLPPPLNVNSTRRSPMGNTRTKWRKFFVKVKGRKMCDKEIQVWSHFPITLCIVFHLQQECRFVISSSTYSTLFRCKKLFLLSSYN